MITLGIDEVGRGCLAGPLVVGAVALDQPIKGLKDSKILSRAQRQKLLPLIEFYAKFIGIGWVSAIELDSIGLTQGLVLATTRATQDLTIVVDEVIIDGNYNFYPAHPLSETLIKADSIVQAVSAASVIAKISRDNYMIKQAEIYPEYGFQDNVGYGTSFHINKLLELGPCLLHRKSFKPLSLMVSKEIL